jgi:hypothetical protein
LYKPELFRFFHEKIRETFFCEYVCTWVFASERFEVPDEVRLIVVTGLEYNCGPIRAILFDQLKDMTEPDDPCKELGR